MDYLDYYYFVRPATHMHIRLHMHYFNQIGLTCLLFWRLRPVWTDLGALMGHTFRFSLQRARGKQVAEETTPL